MKSLNLTKLVENKNTFYWERDVYKTHKTIKKEISS